MSGTSPAEPCPRGRAPQAVLGIDIGGTKTLACMVDPSDGAVIGRAQSPTPAFRSPEEILRVAVQVGDRAVSEAGVPVGACGVGTAGTVDHRGRIASATATMPRWAGADVAGVLGERFGLPVSVLNDVHAMAVGEALRGAGAGSRTVLAVAFGTGVGGGLVLDGRPILGDRFIVGSIGHALADPASRSVCSCGARGHLEAIAAGPALERDYEARSGSRQTLREIAALADGGNGTAQAVLAEAGHLAGRVLGGVANVVDPDVIVVGGGVTGAGDAFVDPLVRGVHEGVLPELKALRVVPAGLGSDAVAVGAAEYAARISL